MILLLPLGKAARVVSKEEEEEEELPAQVAKLLRMLLLVRLLLLNNQHLTLKLHYRTRSAHAGSAPHLYVSSSLCVHCRKCVLILCFSTSLSRSRSPSASLRACVSQVLHR